MNEILIKQQQQLMQQDIRWLSELRENALQQFLKQGFPSTRDEAWKYTNVSNIVARPFQLAPRTIINNTDIQPYVLAEQYAVIINGYFEPALSRLENLPKGVMVSSIASQYQSQSLLTQCLQLKKNAFQALNTAFLQDGVFVYFPRKTTLSTPLQLLFFATAPMWVQPRNVIYLEDYAQATIIETFDSTTSSMTNVVSDVFLQSHAKMDYFKLQREGLQAQHVGHTTIQLATHSRCKTYAISVGSLLARSDLDILLKGDASACELYGMYYTKARQHIDHHTLVDHAAPHTTSHEFYRGVLAEKSRAIFNGKVIVHPQAHHTEASQANHNLLLSSDAEIDTKPELEIYHDEVKCTHGATIGQLDERALFYLRTRGIAENVARQLLIQGFVQQVLATVENTVLKTQLMDICKRCADASK